VYFDATTTVNFKLQSWRFWPDSKNQWLHQFCDTANVKQRAWYCNYYAYAVIKMFQSM